MTSHLGLTMKTPIDSKFKRVYMLGGKNLGKGESYKRAAIELGEALATRRLDLIYSGGITGLLGLVVHPIHRAGGHVTTISLTPLEDEEVFDEVEIIPELRHSIAW